MLLLLLVAIAALADLWYVWVIAGYGSIVAIIIQVYCFCTPKLR